MNIAIITQSASVSPADTAHVAAAIQQQVNTDFGPIWKVGGVVASLPAPRAGFVPVLIVDKPLPSGLGGFHTTQSGMAYAVVQSGIDWSIIASHEVLELMIDPSGSRFQHATVPVNPPYPGNFLMEVCDPCQHKQFAYQTLGGVMVSDFILPNYYDDAPTAGAFYSFRRNVRAPKQVLPGGTVTWVAPNNHAYQVNVDLAGRSQTIDRGIFAPGPMPAREFIHIFTDGYGHILDGGTTKAQRAAAKLRKAHDTASKSHESALKADLLRRIPKPPKRGRKQAPKSGETT